MCKVRAAEMVFVFIHLLLPVCIPGFQVIDPSDRSKDCRQTINISCDAEKVRFANLPHTDFHGNDMSSHKEQPAVVLL
jgi:hypothetical protein